MENVFKGPFILLAYLIGAISIASGAFSNDVVLVLGLLALLVWDLLYVRHPESFKGRSIESTNESVTRARTYISWFIGLYGVLIGIGLSQGDAAIQLSAALERSGTPTWVVALPIVLSVVSMLFVPVQLSAESGSEPESPNTALKMLFFLVVYLQKVVLILIGNLGVRVMGSWG